MRKSSRARAKRIGLIEARDFAKYFIEFEAGDRKLAIALSDPMPLEQDLTGGVIKRGRGGTVGRLSERFVDSGTFAVTRVLYTK